MRNYLFSFFLLLFLNNYSQSIVKSEVRNFITNEPIPNVNIYIKNSKLGVVSNDDGKFKILIPENRNNELLIFSAMGFETLELSANSMIKDSIEIIKLKPSSTILDEVIVKADVKMQPANLIVKKAFDNYYKNFPDKPFLAKGFIRHTEKTKVEYKWLIEAAIEKYDPGFDQPSEDIKVNVQEVRKSLDKRHLDTLRAYNWYLERVKKLPVRKAWDKNIDISTVTLEEINKAIDYYDNYFTLPGWKKSFFYSLFSTNVNKIRFFDHKKATLTKKDLFKKFSFTLDTILYHNANKIFKIKITAPKKVYKQYGKSFVPFGWIYIRDKDYAIFEFEYLTIMGKYYEDFLKGIYGTRVSSVFKSKFIEINGKMYLNYFSFQTPKLNRLRDAFEASRGNKMIESDQLHYYVKEEVVFTEIITDKNEIDEKLKKPWNDNLFSPRAYNEEFWKNYNILLESTEQQKMINDLEKKVKLKDQYKISK